MFKKRPNPNAGNLRASVFDSDSLMPVIEDYVPEPQPVAYGSKVKGVYFDGYPQIVKQEASAPKYKVKVEKNVMVPLRDGVRVAIDVYHPDVKGEIFPVILCWGVWGKDCQDIVEWMGTNDEAQLYFDSPFWDGSMEGCNFMYTVPRGYIHVIADPRGIGSSEGINTGEAASHSPEDIYDTVEWIAAQPWCDGKVCMMGPSSYSRAQLKVAMIPPPHLACIRPDEAPEPFFAEEFSGIWDPLLYNIFTAKHAYDHFAPISYKWPQQLLPPEMMKVLPKEEFDKRLQEVIDNPDVKYSLKFYAEAKNPGSSPMFIDQMMYFMHPTHLESCFENIKVPMYLGTPWNNRLYEWGTFEAYAKARIPATQKKLIIYPPMFPSRPYVWYHDEAIRWFDHWVKGKDTGIMEEPAVKLFVMGINKWKFESEWPLARTKYTKFYLQPQGGLSTRLVQGNCEPESYTQPAPYLDPTVYCLKYRTEPFAADVELTGHPAIYFDASIDIDDTNWMVDLVERRPAGRAPSFEHGPFEGEIQRPGREEIETIQAGSPSQGACADSSRREEQICDRDVTDVECFSEGSLDGADYQEPG